MKKTLNTYDIANELMQDNNANWSRAGAFALAEYLEEYEESTGEELELDVVAIRCEYSEYSDLITWASEYWGDNVTFASGELDLEMDMDGESFQADDNEVEAAIRNYIQDHGQLIEFDGGIIVSSF